MLKTILNLICYILIIAIITGCTLISEDFNGQDTVKYSIDQNTYTEEEETKSKHIEIKYPIISGFENEDTQQLINEQLKNIAFEVLNDFSSLENMDIITSYSIGLSNSKILSVIYIASSFHPVQAYPLVRTHTVNIDLVTGKTMNIDDILNIDENFVMTFLEKCTNIREYNSIEYKERVNQYISDMISYDMFINGSEGSYPEVSGYLTEDSLVISIAVPFSLGSFVLYSADYSDISEYLQIDIN